MAAHLQDPPGAEGWSTQLFCEVDCLEVWGEIEALRPLHPPHTSSLIWLCYSLVQYRLSCIHLTCFV